MTLFERSWARAWRGVSARGDGLSSRDRLLAAYREMHRAYHTLQHLGECLTLFETAGVQADRPSEVEIALWFHDAVYDVVAVDNEERSAAWAESALREAGVDEPAIERVRAAVLATRHAVPAATHDERLTVDIDLAVLGASMERFAEYEIQIRREYGFVPEALFHEKRRAILDGFLRRESVFATPWFVVRFEAAARRNLSR